MRTNLSSLYGGDAKEAWCPHSSLLGLENAAPINQSDYDRVMKHPTIAASFKLPPNYMPWKDLQQWFAAMHLQADGLGDGSVQADLCTGMLGHDFPFFLLGSQFVDMLGHTDALLGVNILTEAPLPFPVFTMILPRGAMRLKITEEMDVALLVVMVGESQRNNGRLGMKIAALSFDVINDAYFRQFSTSVGLTEDGTLMDNPDDLRTAFERVGQGGDPRLAAEASIEMARFVSKVLASMAAEPTLVEQAKKEGERKARKGKRALQFWSPKTIGMRVCFNSRLPTEPGGGTVRAHWRRGFLRRQHYGKNNAMTKIVKIAPVLVNKPEEVEGG